MGPNDAGNLVHGMRTEGTGCSPPSLYRRSYCRHRVTDCFGGYPDAPRYDADCRPVAGLHRHAANCGCQAVAAENVEGNDGSAGCDHGRGAPLRLPDGQSPPRGGVAGPAGGRRSSACCCRRCRNRRNRGSDHGKRTERRESRPHRRHNDWTGAKPRYQCPSSRGPASGPR